MKVIGITGGIGSGKSYVCKIIEEMGFAVYYSDKSAKFLMDSNEHIQKELKRIIGDDAYTLQGLNRELISNKIFSDTTLRQKMNQLIHPIVREDFEQWKKSFTDNEFIFNEAAILFETGSYINYDSVILVYAPLKLKIERIKKRDEITEEEVLKKMKSQWSDAQKMKLTPHHILNDGKKNLRQRISVILDELSKPV